MDKLKIVPYKATYKSEFEVLNRLWIEKYFVMEDEDRRPFCLSATHFRTYLAIPCAHANTDTRISITTLSGGISVPPVGTVRVVVCGLF